jgi:hypothetical protein
LEKFPGAGAAACVRHDIAAAASRRYIGVVSTKNSPVGSDHASARSVAGEFCAWGWHAERHKCGCERRSAESGCLLRSSSWSNPTSVVRRVCKHPSAVEPVLKQLSFTVSSRSNKR